MYHYVYQITNLLNNMIYVGKRSSKNHPDIDPYFGSGIRLNRAIKKYGKESFKKEIVAIVDSAEEAEELEELIVDADFIARKDTYNMIVGGGKGTRGMVQSDETKTKISEAIKGKKYSDKHREKMSEARKGKKRSAMADETKAKISESNKGKKRGTISEEHRAKLSAALKGREFSDEHRAKLSEAKKGKKQVKRKEYKWMTNGKISKLVKPDDVNNFIESGFSLGRCSK